MPQFQIPTPKTLYISKTTKTSPNGEAIIMKNFIPTLGGGLKLRKGHKFLNFESIDFIATFKETNTLVLFSKIYGLTILNQVYSVVYTDPNFKDIPINYIETNERLLLFFETETVKELNYNNNIYNIEEVKFNGNLGRVFLKAVKYSQRLFFIEKNSNIIYFAAVLAYKGDLATFDVSNVFGAKGSVINISLLGYLSGVGAISNFVIAFDKGDILLYKGVDPENINEWFCERIISTNLNILDQSINYASNLYLLTSNGLLDLQTAIQSNNVAMATTLLIPIQEAINFNQARTFMYKEYIIVTQYYSNDVYFFDTRLQSFFCITNFKFNFVEEFSDKLIFIDVLGNLYEAFASKNDNGESVRGEVATGWLDLGTSNNKRVTFINCGMFYASGDYNIQTGVFANNNIIKGILKKLPSIAPNLPRWSDITPTWRQTSRLWFGSSVGVYKSVKFPKVGFGRNLSFYFVVESNNIDGFEFQDLSIDFDMTQF